MKALGRIIHALYGLWFVSVFALCAVLALFAVLLPGLALRQALVTSLTRIIFLAAGTGPEVIGKAHLPDGQHFQRFRDRLAPNRRQVWFSSRSMARPPIVTFGASLTTG